MSAEGSPLIASVLYAKRRDATCVDYDNCRAINGLSGVVATPSDKAFEDHMRARGHAVIWVDDLDKAWERRNPR